MTATGYPKVTLDNGVLSARVYLPDATRGYYRGTRFDWSGIVDRVDYAGHRFFAPLYVRHDPLCHDSVGGPAEEFAMSRPMGFAEAAVGEPFLKIGVGLLAKGDDHEYRFDGDYQLLRPGTWDIEHEPDRVTFRQSLAGERGWACRYTKVLHAPPGRGELVIGHRLDNTGANTIDIDNYNHNFTLIDDVPYGPDYRVELPFTSDEPVSINGLAWFRDGAVELDRPLGTQALWCPLFEGEGTAAFNAARVHNRRTGASVAFEGDAAVSRVVFWAVERAVCPEPFIRLHLAPGQAKSWQSRYRFGVDRRE